MALDELLSYTWANGVGISYATAQRRPRYPELIRRYRRKSYPPELPMIEFLGECLADRAAKNLPQAVKKNLDFWHQGKDMQMLLVQTLMGSLSSKGWEKASKSRTTAARRRRYNQSVKAVLPAQTGSWSRGAIQPNCLGVAQLLVGFARAVGARHYLINVIRSSDRFLIWNQIQSYEYIRDSLLGIGHPRLERLARNLGRTIEFNYGTLDHVQRQGAHHALLIEMCDGEWLIVDPYLLTLHPAKFSRQQLRRLDAARNKVIAVKEITMVERLKSMLLDFRIMTDYFKATGMNNGSDLAVLGAWAACTEIDAPIEMRSSLLDTLWQDRDFDLAFRKALGYAALRWDKRKLSQKELDERVQLARRRQRARYQAGARMVLYAYYNILDFLNSSEMRQHRTYEICSPALMLGLCTLNHVRAKTGIQASGRLAAIAISQPILADALNAHEEGDTISRDNKPEIGKMLRKIAATRSFDACFITRKQLERGRRWAKRS